MKLGRIDLLTLLISLFVFVGCEKPDQIGLELDPDDVLNSDTLVLDVETKLLKEDSIPTNGTEVSVLAYMKDQVFGTTVSNMALALTLPTTNVDFGTNPQLDSAVLVLPYAGLYGDSALYKAEVRQLNEILYVEGGKTYYNTKTWARNSTLVAEKSFFPSYRDSINVDVYGVKNSAGTGDSTIKVIPQLRVPLNNNFISSNILSLDSATLSTSKKFADAFKGLYVSLDQASAPANGGAITFNTSASGGARVDVFYRTTDEDGNLDTLTLSLPILNGSAVSEIKWDVGTDVQAALDQSGPNNDKIYLKGLAGTKVQVTFPEAELDKIRKNAELKNIAINRAELIVPADEPAQSTFVPLPVVRIYRWDIAEQPQYIPDETQTDPRYLGAGFIGGVYSNTTKNAAINVTGYFHDILYGKTVQYGTFLTTFDFVTGNGRLSFPGRTIFNGGGSSSSNKIRLKIFYTDLK